MDRRARDRAMAKPPSPHRGLRLGPADVMLQLLDHEFPVADDALDQITDRDNAEKLTIIDHRQMAHALGAHGQPPAGGCNRVAFSSVSFLSDPQCVPSSA